ncbi:DUF3857 domain-containing protein [Asticcacaulis sp. YBE204]|uniref:DUF3857 domain-containing protein n=1 Tax=Asticcacaulis sp. YBE204 TaxID=1282363 RepID=UPI0003C3E397|nr:DUF3857 domain-containing protein [Asticcacaulis sp. YBE204]ESQ80266.1 hypothetical protein AEYBE204_06495 [Asticcacaulis sp. YBE204]
MGKLIFLKGVATAVVAMGATGAPLAWSDETIHYGPVEAWVTPVPPLKAPPPKPDASDVPLRIVLLNSQLSLDDDANRYYSEIVVQIQTPAGLDAGQKAVVWNPQTQTVTINKLQIQRDGEVIDLLAKGQTFTILRRENNLETSMLDGVLTGVLQPEDVRVGDIISYAFTVCENDPILKGNAEALLYNAMPLTAERLYMRAEWPKTKPVRYRVSSDFADAKVALRKDRQSVVIDRTDAVVPKAPKFAPLRYRQFSQLHLSQFADWAAVSGLMAPHYGHDLPPASPLNAEVEKLRKLPDQKAQAMAALRLVQDQVRYVFIGLNQGSYIPATPDETWARRFGDCKGKTVLLLALLKGLGIEAEAVLVSTVAGDGLNERLPGIGMFNHVLVRATIDGKTYWMDGTRSGDRALDRLPVPDVSWGLPVKASGADLIRIEVPPPTLPLWDYSLTIDATKGLDIPAPTEGEIVLRGDTAIAIRQSAGAMMPSERDKVLRKYWKDEYDFIEPTTVSLTFDETTGDAHLRMTGKAKMAWRYTSKLGARRYETDGYSLGWTSDLARDDGPNKDAPIALDYPLYNRHSETIRLPYDGEGFTLDGENVDTTLSARHFRRQVKLDKGVFTMEASTRALQPEIALAEAETNAPAIKALSDKDVYLVAPQKYTATEAEMAALRATTPKTAQEYLQRGRKLLSGGGHYDDALADFNAGLKLDPKSGALLTNRGLVLFSLKRFDEAQADFEQALTLNAHDWQAMRGMAYIYWQRKQYRQASDLLLRISEAIPGDTEILGMLAATYAGDGQQDKAIEIFRKITTLEADNPKAYLSLAHALLDCGPVKGEACDARRAEAVEAYDRAIALKPTASLYAKRQAARPKSARQARFDDMDKALALEPTSATLIRTKIKLHIEYEDYAPALDLINGLIEAAPKDLRNYELRVDIHKGMKRDDLAAADIDAIKALDTDKAMLFNTACWLRATRNFELDKAKADCTQALKLSPDEASYMDSSAFVELRLGNHAAAIKLYDTALKAEPDQAESLFGRGIAKIRLGQTADGQKDIEAARVIDDEIETTFKGYGVTP